MTRYLLIDCHMEADQADGLLCLLHTLHESGSIALAYNYPIRHGSELIYKLDIIEPVADEALSNCSSSGTCAYVEEYDITVVDVPRQAYTRFALINNKVFLTDPAHEDFSVDDWIQWCLLIPKYEVHSIALGWFSKSSIQLQMQETPKRKFLNTILHNCRWVYDTEEVSVELGSMSRGDWKCSRSLGVYRTELKINPAKKVLLGMYDFLRKVPVGCYLLLWVTCLFGVHFWIGPVVITLACLCLFWGTEENRVPYSYLPDLHKGEYTHPGFPINKSLRW